jgi:hypothetical protein
MSKAILRIVGAICVVLIAFFVTTFLIQEFADQPESSADVTGSVDPCGSTSPTRLAGPFAPWGGFAFAADISNLSDTSDSMNDPSRSKLVLCEDGRPLGPPHSAHEDIRKMGLGRYSHWGADVVFSASDNTNPNMNSRSYWVVVDR